MRRRGTDDEKADDEKTSLLGPSTETKTEFGRETLLEHLRDRVAQPYGDHHSHHRWLQDIWDQAFPLEEFQLPSEQWKVLGFQGRDPRTDLRGAGAFGLRHLRCYFQSFPAADFAEMFHSYDPLSSLPIAIASINCTAMLLMHFQLAPKLTCAFLPGGRVECTPEILHGLLSLGFEGDEAGAPSVSADGDAAARAGGGADARAAQLQRALEAMHVRLLLHLSRTWKAMGAKDPTLNLMHFPVALRRTFEHLQRALQVVQKQRPASPHRAAWRLDEVTLALEQEYTSPGAFGGVQGFGSDDADPIFAACDCVVRPAGYVLWATYALACGLLTSAFGTCGLQFGGGDAAAVGSVSRKRA